MYIADTTSKYLTKLVEVRIHFIPLLSKRSLEQSEWPLQVWIPRVLDALRGKQRLFLLFPRKTSII